MPESQRGWIEESTCTSLALDLFSEDESAIEDGGSKVPATIPILPNRKHVKTRDGREFVIEDPQALIDEVRAGGVDLVVGRQHDEVGSIFGSAGPAAGWIDHKTGLKRRGKYGVVADVDWTDIGSEYIRSRSGRYVSPVLSIPGMFDFLYGEGDVPKVESILAASVVTIPALGMPSLNSRRMAAGELRKMNEEIRTKLCLALGLPPDAKGETILSAVEAKQDELTKLSSAIESMPEGAGASGSAVDLTQWVPRQEFDAMAQRLSKVEEKAQESRVDELIRRNKNKIQTPEFEKVLREQLSNGSLSTEAFDALMKATPESRLTAEDEQGDHSADIDALGLEGYEVEFCKENNIEPAKFAEAKKRRQRRRTIRAI